MNTNQNISDQTLQWIRTCVPIPGIIATTHLKPSGDQLVASCPFPDHDDQRPSFYVSLPKRRFYCHGCKRGGDVIELYRQLYGASFRQAVEALLERSGPPPSTHRRQPSSSRHPGSGSQLVTSNKQREILAEVATIYRHRAESSPEFSEYLDGLGFDAAQRQGLGWAPSAGVDLERFFNAEEQKILLDLGLLDRNAGRTFERMRSAIIFTVTHFAGAAVGFVGRRLEGQPKYLNSSFPKRVFPLGLAEARETIIQSRRVTLVEGPFDWLAMRAEGITNVLALLGSDISDALLSLLQVLGVTSANVLLDGDSPGRVAGKIAETRIRSSGIDACLLELPSEMDPADLWRDKGPGAIRAFLETPGTNQTKTPDEESASVESSTS